MPLPEALDPLGQRSGAPAEASVRRRLPGILGPAPSPPRRLWVRAVSRACQVPCAKPPPTSVVEAPPCLRR